jgi:hypothetical protein
VSAVVRLLIRAWRERRIWRERGVSIRRRERRERGFVTIEMLWIVPLVIVPVMLFGLYASRVGLMSIRVERASREAARAASQQLEPVVAREIAERTLVDALGVEQWQRCVDSPRTSIDVEGVGVQPEGYKDQGEVTVVLDCRVDLAIFGPLISTEHRYVVRAIESVDQYRSRAPS